MKTVSISTGGIRTYQHIESVIRLLALMAIKNLENVGFLFLYPCGFSYLLIIRRRFVVLS